MDSCTVMCKECVDDRASNAPLWYPYVHDQGGWNILVSVQKSIIQWWLSVIQVIQSLDITLAGTTVFKAELKSKKCIFTPTNPAPFLQVG